MLRLRQIVWVAEDLAGAEADVSALTGLDVCYRDPGVAAFGLHNALFVAGDQFLEIVSPQTSPTTAGRLLDKRGGDGGYMVILQTDDLGWVHDRAEAQGVRVVWEAEHEGTRGIHLHPADVGAAILSIDRSEEPAEWAWGGPTWRDHVDTSVVTGVAGVELQAADPDDVAARWSALLDRPVEDRTIRLDDAELRFVEASDGRGDGVRAYDLVAADRSRVGETHDVRGVLVNLV